MKNIIILLSLLTCFVETAFSQTQIDNFAFMQGNWVGILEYTDYQDDKSKVQLKTSACFAQMFNKIVSQYTYTEPDGSLVYDKGQISMTKKGDRVNFGGQMLNIITHTEGGTCASRRCRR